MAISQRPPVQRFRFRVGFVLVAATSLVLTGLMPAIGLPVQPPHPYFSLDAKSASLAQHETSGDIFRIDIDAGEPTKALSLHHEALGLSGKRKANVDAISNGLDVIGFLGVPDPCWSVVSPQGTTASSVYYWSVDRKTKGRSEAISPALPWGNAGNGCEAAFGPVEPQAGDHEASADVFYQLWDAGPPPNPGARFNLLLWDEAAIDLSDRDEIDALETDAKDHTTANGVGDEARVESLLTLVFPLGPVWHSLNDVFFSVDKTTAKKLGVNPADVLFVSAGSNTFEVRWSAEDLGLSDRDDIDALCVDVNGFLSSLGGPVVAFSLDRKSPSLKTGTPLLREPKGKYSPADLFVVHPEAGTSFPGSGPIELTPYIYAEFLSLRADDNVDGFDCDWLDPGGRGEPPPVE